MRKTLLAIVAVAGLSVPVVALAARKRHIHFTTKIVGAQISATQAVYKAHDSHFGNGAGVQTVKLTGLDGTDKEITYYGNAAARSKGTFKLGTPDAKGNATLTGSGHDVGGTGTAKRLRSTYTYRGTFNLNTGIFNVTLTGTYTLG
jgi:hypothetical protein